MLNVKVYIDAESRKPYASIEGSNYFQEDLKELANILSKEEEILVNGKILNKKEIENLISNFT